MKPKSTAKAELPELAFPDQQKWAAWLQKNHASSPGLWLKIAKKESGITSVTYPEALDEALCYGWIDGQKKGLDDSYWLQKFTPRGPRSIWSVINQEKVAKLIEAGRMQPAGLAAVERAKENGQWASAYHGSKRSTMPEDFQAELDQRPKAKEFFATINSANRYAILFRLQTAKKPETRTKRMQQFLEMLERGEMLHPPEKA